MFRALGRIADEPGGPGFLASPAQRQSNTDFLAASGEVLPDSVHVTRGFYRVALPAGQTDSLPDGPYAVQLMDAAGSVLSQRTFGPAHLSNDTPGAGGPFQLLLPWVEGASQVVFLRGGTEIGRYQASAGTPTVNLLSPNGGEAWPAQGTQKIRWEAGDSDSPDLTYVVQYSPDNGGTWNPLVNFTRQTEVSVDTSTVAGSSQALVRVVASDGFNTATDVSSAPFTVAGKGPYLAILSPDDGATFATGREVVLQGAATDLEDGPIEAASLSWSSSLDGPLGSGSSLWALELSPGRHTLTLTGADGGGEIASESVTITVGGAVSSPRPLPLAAIFWVAGLLLVGVSGLGILVYALRGRGARR
jgi:hypothetical protein